MVWLAGELQELLDHPILCSIFKTDFKLIVCVFS